VGQTNNARLGVAFTSFSLDHDVKDDRFIRIVDDIASLIASSEAACARAMQGGNDDYADAVITTETDYLEDLIGTLFLMLQTKIRRVGEAAVEVSKALENMSGPAAQIWADPRAVRAEGGDYKGTGHSLVELVWAIGNYFKHRDEWSPEVWNPPTPVPNRLKQSIATRMMVQHVKIVESSTGNMRMALEFLGVDPYSQCAKLAQDVQTWADAVRGKAAAVAKANGYP
jgi:hypothetical protein